MPDPAISGWRRQVRRPLFIGVTAVVAVLVAGGATAFAASGSGGSGYRLTKVVRASVDNSLVVVGSVEPVKTASASFQVAGQVATVTASVGQQVTAGQALGTLDTAALSESVSSAQSSLNADEAKLTEDENSQTSSTPAAATTTTTTTARGSTGTSGGSGSASSQITQDQSALVADQSKASAAQSQELADLTQAESTCETSNSSPPQSPPTSGTTTTTTTAPSSTTTTTTPPPTDASGCTTALEQVSSDQQAVSHDQGAVATDEDNLAKALAQEASSASSSSTHSSSAASSPASSPSSTSGGSNFGPSSASGGGSASAAVSDSPAQIDADQANIDTAEANLVLAEQSLAAAQLTTPISGTIASVGLSVGATVGANSISDAVVIVGTQSFEATSTLTSAQVVSVKVGQQADVTIDGSSGSIVGTVSQVGPVQVSSGTYSYPVVIALPASATGLFSGSSANISIFTSAANNVLAVPTSAVLTSGTRNYVLVLSAGTPVEKTVKTGIVGNVYTQVLSGLQLGGSVVLANDSQAVPASSVTTLGGFGGFGGAGGGGRFNVTQVGPGGGGGSGVRQLPAGG